MPVPGPPPAPAGISALDEARARLVALDDVPLEQHPEQFTSIDSLLRSALDGTDRALRS